MAEIDHCAGESLSDRKTEVGDLISDGVHDDGWMVIVFGDHGSCVILPPCFECSSAEIIRIFLDAPHVECFIHHIHAKCVTGI